MPEKVKKVMPWLSIIAISIGLMVGLSFVFDARQTKADTTTPSVAVGNAIPSISNISLNGGLAITLVENNTTSTNCTATLTDTNGGADITSATATIYYSAVSGGAACGAASSTCYQIASGCSLGSVSGNNRPVTCTASLQFYATATDTFGEIWTCRVTGIDSSAAIGSATNTTQAVELNTLEALILESAISYGTLSSGATSSQSSSLYATTTGNVAVDVNVSGQALKKNSTTLIDVPYQEYSLTTVNYGSGTDLATSTAALKLQSGPPTQSPSDAVDILYWRMGIPGGQEIGTYSGTTTIDATTNTG